MLPLKIINYPRFEKLLKFISVNGLIMQSLLSHLTLTKNKVFFYLTTTTKKNRLLIKQSGHVRSLVLEVRL